MVFTKLLNIVGILNIYIIKCRHTVTQSLSFRGGTLILSFKVISILPGSKKLALGFLEVWLLA